MKHLLPLLLVITLACSTKEPPRNFQGTLTYLQDIVIPQAYINMGTTKEILVGQMKQEGLWADTVIVVYDGAGNYRLTMNNAQKAYKIYRADSNRIYTFVKTPEMEQCIVQDAVEFDLSTQAVMRSVMVPVDTSVTINGVSCATIRMRGGQGIVDYYYDSTQLRIEPHLFSRHTLEGWSDYVKRSKSLPLGIRRRNIGGIELIQTLAGYKSETVDPKLFILPPLEKDASLNPFRMPGVEVRRVRKGR
jgi:hypothetical protein